MDHTPFDTRRRLCPDGNCLGVIGADGRCKVCGRATGATPAAAAAPEAPAGRTDEADEDGHAASAAGASGSPFDPNRRLCEDGTCVGVIGPDGLCGSCGKKWS